jgi:anaerobic ribonucleoside-triphosphate reductase activating protein
MPWIRKADGITITGGEPFDQVGALYALLLAVKQKTNTNVLVFSGYEFHSIQEQITEMSGLIDALISGPYRADVGQTRALRGSDNQVLHLLTPLGREIFADLDAAVPTRRIDMMMSSDGSVYFAGIPAPGDFSALKAILEDAGHRFITTQDKREA